MSDSDSAEFGTYPQTNIFLQTDNPENDEEFEISNLGLDLDSSNQLMPLVYYVGSDTPLGENTQIPPFSGFAKQIPTVNPSANMSRFNNYLLLFIFYVYKNDKLQNDAISELKRRKFSYDNNTKIWSRNDGKQFNPNSWEFVDPSQYGYS